MARARVLLVMLAVAALGVPPDADACSCEYVSREQEYERADAVFVGTVDSVQHRGEYIVATFRVVTAWKGVASETIEVATEASTDACGADFATGGEFLVYARRKHPWPPPFDIMKDWSGLTTQSCSTRQPGHPWSDFDFLKSLPKNPEQTRSKGDAGSPK